jgi:hypothetical protein
VRTLWGIAAAAEGATVTMPAEGRAGATLSGRHFARLQMTLPSGQAVRALLGPLARPQLGKSPSEYGSTVYVRCSLYGPSHSAVLHPAEPWVQGTNLRDAAGAIVPPSAYHMAATGTSEEWRAVVRERLPLYAKHNEAALPAAQAIVDVFLAIA